MHRIEVAFKHGVKDAAGEKIAKSVKADLGISKVGSVRTIDVFTVDSDALSSKDLGFLGKEVFSDAIVNEYSVDAQLPHNMDFDWAIEVNYKPGVTDNVGRTAKEAIQDALKKQLDGEVYYSRQYLFKGNGEGNLLHAEMEKIASGLLANKLIEQYSIKAKKNSNSWGKAWAPKVMLSHDMLVAEIDLNVPDEKLAAISKKGLLALSLEEMRAIRNYFALPGIIAERKKFGLGNKPTDAELEAIAQTWSEHCKHKIFNAEIEYEEDGRKEKINSLFKTFIRSTTEKIERKDLVSVFVDNAGIVEFDKSHNYAIKVETHNSPSALDPYGGALTGILGVNRDVLGAGLGAKMVFNTNVFCFGLPTMVVPEKIIAPKRIFEGVRKGVQDGGNKSGIPTVNGSIVFDERFAYRPLVYCGTCGIMPKKAGGKLTHEKAAVDADLIVMVGGRIGKDGIHGATFSSIEVSESSPATAVQIGDPITQKKMADFLLEARDNGLYDSITDNGAGGLSSSVGEMAQSCNGFEMHLDKAPLKYHGLQPWEILVSEAQERMSIAVPEKNLEKLRELAKKHEVEITVLGKFTGSGKYHCLYNGKTVAFLGMDFLHKGVPQLKLKAEWQNNPQPDPEIPAPKDYNALLKQMLSRLNICSKEYVVRQYDHEVQGGTVVKPLTGRNNDGPSDAAVVRPLLGGESGLVVSNGICPKYSDIDAGAMAECAVDEAIRNYISVGGNIETACGLDNFCWCDTLPSPTNPNAERNLAQLVRACRHMHHACVEYGVPLVSGKDSMKNDYLFPDGKRISIPPTLLVTVVGKIENAVNAVTMDAKNPGDIVFVLGTTKKELGASEYYAMHSAIGNSVPRVNAKKAVQLYRALGKTMSLGFVESCHDCSDGGLGVALSETAFAGNLGMEIDLSKVPREQEMQRDDFVLFSESQGRLVATVKKENAKKFEEILHGNDFAAVGTVTQGPVFVVHGLDGKKIIDCTINELRSEWKKTLEW